jgi:DNA primase
LVSRKIAELKSSLQRLNPLENEVQYNESFAELVSLETQKRGLHELSIGSL